MLCTSLRCLFGSNGIVFTSKKGIYINCHQNIVSYFCFCVGFIFLELFSLLANNIPEFLAKSRMRFKEVKSLQ